MFEFDFRNIIVLVSLGIHATLLWLLVHYGRRQVSGRAYLIAILAIVGWIIPMIFYRAHYAGLTLLWARLLYAMASFTSTSFFIFTLTFPENKVPKWWIQWLVLAENLAILYLVFHPALFITGITELKNTEDVIHFTKLYFVYAAHISLFFMAGFIVLLRKIWQHRGAARQEVRHQILMIFWGYFFASNLAMTTNLWMPWTGNFELNWIGQFFSTLVAGFTTYAILKHRFLTPKVIVTEIFIVILNFILFIQLGFSTGAHELLVGTIVLIGVLVVSFGLLKGVINEVTRREQVQKLAEQLETANTRLTELDRAKSEFISIAAHQLRTPLSVIKGYLSLIFEGSYGAVSAALKEILGKMNQNNERLIRLVDDFLDVTRIESGRTQYEFEPTKLEEIVESMVEEFQSKAAAKGLMLTFEPPKSALPKVKIDADKIMHALNNFIDNAIKYTEKGKVTVRVRREGKAVAVTVRDTGVGMDEADRQNVFQKFYRGKAVSARFGPGTGLGLYVAKRFVEAHKGEIFAQSKGAGRGSTFGFTIPIVQ